MLVLNYSPFHGIFNINIDEKQTKMDGRNIIEADSTIYSWEIECAAQFVKIMIAYQKV